MVVFLFLQHLESVIVLALLFSYVFLVLVLNNAFLLSKGIKKGLEDIKKERWYWALVLIFIALLFIWHFSFEAIIFLTLFVSFALYAWDSRILTGIALAFLISCPILLISKKEDIAEQMAVYAYFFLVMTVVLQIVEYLKASRKSKEENSKDNL